MNFGSQSINVTMGRFAVSLLLCLLSISWIYFAIPNDVASLLHSLFFISVIFVIYRDHEKLSSVKHYSVAIIAMTILFSLNFLVLLSVLIYKLRGTNGLENVFWLAVIIATITIIVFYLIYPPSKFQLEKIIRYGVISKRDNTMQFGGAADDRLWGKSSGKSKHILLFFTVLGISTVNLVSGIISIYHLHMFWCGVTVFILFFATMQRFREYKLAVQYEERFGRALVIFGAEIN